MVFETHWYNFDQFLKLVNDACPFIGLFQGSPHFHCSMIISDYCLSWTCTIINYCVWSLGIWSYPFRYFIDLSFIMFCKFDISISSWGESFRKYFSKPAAMILRTIICFHCWWFFGPLSLNDPGKISPDILQPSINLLLI